VDLNLLSCPDAPVTAELVRLLVPESVERRADTFSQLRRLEGLHRLCEPKKLLGHATRHTAVPVNLVLADGGAEDRNIAVGPEGKSGVDVAPARKEGMLRVVEAGLEDLLVGGGQRLRRAGREECDDVRAPRRDHEAVAPEGIMCAAIDEAGPVRGGKRLIPAEAFLDARIRNAFQAREPRPLLGDEL